VRRRLLEHVRLPLHRDAYALALNSAFTAATGLLYWILAAHTFSTHAVGLNFALISAMTFLSGLASLNLPNIIVRFLPESGNRTLARVVCAYAVAAALAACAAVVFILGVGSWTPRLGFLGSDHGLQAWFVFSTIAWCLFVIQDSVLTALRRAVWVPLENAVFSLLKIALLAAAATAAPRYGIFVSWTIAMLVSVAGVNFLIFTRLMRRTTLGPLRAVDVRNRAFASYFAADYACSMAWQANLYLMPLVVTAVAGATTNAYWALAFTVAFPLYGVAMNFGTSLMLHATIERAALPALARKAAIQGARVLVPAVALLVLVAPLLLSLFGPGYADHGTTVLRLLALGALPNFVIVLSVHIARVQRRLRRAVIALGADALIALGAATPLVHAMGVTGVGIGWTAAQFIVATGLLLTWRSSFHTGTAPAATAQQPGVTPVDPRTPQAPQQQAPEQPDVPSAEASLLPDLPWPPGLQPDLQCTDARLQPDLPGPQAALQPNLPGPEASEVHPLLRALFAALEQRGLRWTLLRVPSSLAAPTGDVDILVAPEDSAALSEAARKLGFVALPGWESAPDLILVRYDRASDRWLLLDVSTSVSFRSPRSWRLPDATEQVLWRRSLSDGVALPAEADAFWLLLLHCLLDKGRVASHYRERLRRLAPAAMESPLGASVCAAAGPAFAQRDFVAAAEAGDTDALLELGVRLADQLRRRRPLTERWQVLLSRAVRAARRPLLLRRRKGMSLALLGPNGVGKSTAAAALQRSLPFEVRIVYMGMWKLPDKERGRVAVVMEIATRPLRIWHRYLKAQYHQLRGRVVVFDRYVYDALLPPSPPLLMAKRAYFLFLAHVLPRPRAAVFLDVAGDVAYGRKPEAPPDELESERRLYGELVRRSFAVELVDAGADADTVRAEITTIVWRELTLRWHGVCAPA
jgi:O-antigen/teichoic acid export membrane protein